jgi:hypothetical protein
MTLKLTYSTRSPPPMAIILIMTIVIVALLVRSGSSVVLGVLIWSRW